MLKLNSVFWFSFSRNRAYLNTSYVKVKHNTEWNIKNVDEDLNTSYVKVKLVHPKPVAVPVGFKYILC